MKNIWEWILNCLEIIGHGILNHAYLILTVYLFFYAFEYLAKNWETVKSTQLKEVLTPTALQENAGQIIVTVLLIPILYLAVGGSVHLIKGEEFNLIWYYTTITADVIIGLYLLREVIPLLFGAAIYFSGLALGLFAVVKVWSFFLNIIFG